MKNLFLVGWNDEYLDMRIVAGPFSEEEKCKVIEAEVIKMIIKDYGIESEASAKQCLEMSYGVDENISVSENGASIIYGTGYEDRIQVVKYNHKLRIEVNTPSGKIYSKVMPDDEYIGIATLIDKPGEPGVITEYDPERKCIVSRVYTEDDTDREPKIFEYK